MASPWKRGVNAALGSLGYEIRRHKPKGDHGQTFFDGLLRGLLSGKAGKLCIVQIGANDGYTNDPLRAFAMSHRGSTSILLIEPQPDVYEALLRSYARHPGARFANVAIGRKKEGELFRVKDEIKSAYAATGRNPTGVTSVDKEHVIRHVRRYLRLTWENAERFVEPFAVEFQTLSSVLKQNKFQSNIDVLQIDVEGVDDDVIYASDITTVLPRVINYEYKHLSEEKRERLRAHLTSAGYQIERWSQSDECAIRETGRMCVAQ